ncbi:MAG: TetR/AcrR family transcriptional regulator [Anaerolineae bacterium]|nr:TetR/AcrR family transcriptional regulator [Anaerolineae bacterium]
MSKGEQTREAILRQAAAVFNQQGYFGASMSDIMRATGLEKGGIYNHFGSKDQLALEAFDYAFGLLTDRLRDALQGKTNSVDRLLTLVEVIGGQVEDGPLPGGCPILNTAVEADDTHPALREKARQAVEGWFGVVHRNVTRGIERGHIRPAVVADEVATLMVATIEGSIMLSKLYGDPVYVHRAIEFLRGYLDSLRAVAD